MLNLLADATLALRSLPVPTLCGVQGGAIAGGCALAAATDFVVSHSDAKFGYPVTRLGVSPAVSGPVLLPAIGEGHARERLLDPGLITGDVAERIGLVWKCVATPEEMLDAVLSKAHSLAAKPSHGLSATKRWINELDDSTDLEFLASGRAVSNATAQSDEHANLLAHVWKGK
jgi:enoyl-CoA hydratase/carnithine racemase